MAKQSNDPDYVPATAIADRTPYLRTDVDDLGIVKADSPLDLHIMRLLNLHPALKVRFRNQDLTQLNVQAKQALLDDMNDVLGISPLNVQ